MHQVGMRVGWVWAESGMAVEYRAKSVVTMG